MVTIVCMFKKSNGDVDIRNKTQVKFLEMRFSESKKTKNKLDGMNGRLDITGEESHELKTQQNRSNRNDPKRTQEKL